MRWLNVVVVVNILINSCVAELHVVPGLRTSNNVAEDSLNYVDNLMGDLFASVREKKAALEDDSLWPRDYAKEYFRNGSISFDYIIVGAGTAGSVLASRLSENPAVKVLLLEAGDNPPIQSEIHTLSMQMFHTSYIWNDYAEANPFCCQAMKNAKCYWPRGKMIGGTGAANGNVFMSGVAADYDEWQQQGNEGWSWKEVYPFIANSTIDLGNGSHPLGSLHLSFFERLESFAVLQDLIRNATKQATGYDLMPNILGTVNRGIRMSTGKTYLAKVAPHRANLYVTKNSVVTQILFRNDTLADSVTYLSYGKRKIRVRASKEIILSAGTFNTPKILMLSGIGPQAELRRFDIPLVRDLAVGKNFQDHGMMPLIIKFTKNIPSNMDTITPNSLYDLLMFQKGPLAASSTLIGFINTKQQVRPDIMVVSHFGLPTKDSNVFDFLQFKTEIVDQFLSKVGNQMILELEGLIVKPKSRSFIRLKSRNPSQSPEIHNNMATEPEDRQALLRFVRYVQSLQNTEAFKYYGLELVTIPLPECDNFVFDSDDYWFCYIKYFYISAWHAAGSCRMGPATDPSAVVDQRLRVHGIRGLRVVDASIMPNITSANTNGPTIMIAEKAAQLIKEDWS